VIFSSKTHIVIESYSVAYPNPIKLRVGELVKIEKWEPRDSAWAGWAYCESSQGVKGWVSQTYLMVNGSIAKVIKDYDATELAVQVGEEVDIIQEEFGWLRIQNAKRDQGWVPKTVLITKATPQIRYAVEDDLQRLTDINNYYIENTNATFDNEPQTVVDRLPWFNRFKETGPYRLLVAEYQNLIIGCAYSSPYRDHYSFNQTIETSIYLAHDQIGKGVGSKLYHSLFAELKNEPLHLAVAGIAIPNEASIKLHEKFGFQKVGIFEEYAKKRGQYISSIWLQKKIKFPN
jgi:phosphinothricin acetyltransferase